MSKMAESMADVVKMAKENNRVCYLYHRTTGNFQYRASFVLWNDWIFKAYPGGRTVLRQAGLDLLDERERELTK